MADIPPIVIVAAQEIFPGMTVSADELYAVEFDSEEWARWPSTPFTAPEAVIGQTAVLRILENELVVPERLGMPAQARFPAAGTVGLVAVGEPAPSVDLVSPVGCTWVAGAPVLRTGAGTLLVEVPPSALPRLVTGGVVRAIAAGSGVPACDAPIDLADESSPVVEVPPAVAPEPATTRERQWIPVAIRDLPAGRLVSPDDVAMVDWPLDFVPDAVAEEPVGRPLVEPVFRGEFFREERFGAARSEAPPAVRQPYLAARSPAGAPWWPTDPVAVLDRAGCVGAVGTVAAAKGVRALSVSRSVESLPASAVAIAGAKDLPPRGTVVLLPADGVPPGLCEATPAVPPPAPPVVDPGRDVDPCVDFYAFACGGKGAEQEGLDRARLHNDAKLVHILARDDGGLGELYRECTDRRAIDAAGLAPLDVWRGAIAKVSTTDDALGIVGSLEALDVPTWFDLGWSEGRLIVAPRAPRAPQPGAPPESVRLDLITGLLAEMGDPDPLASARAVTALDAALVPAAPTDAQPQIAITVYGLAGPVQTRLQPLFASLGAPPGTVGFEDPPGIQRELSILDATPPEVVRDALLVHLLLGVGLELSDRIRAPELAFAAWLDPGTDEELCMKTVWSLAPDATERLFADRTVSPAAVERASRVFGDVRQQLAAAMRAINPPAVAAPEGGDLLAMILAAVAVQGDPATTTWSIGAADGSGLVPRASGSWFADWSQARVAAVRGAYGESPSERTWGPDANAWYDPANNHVVVLPGLLWPPVFDPHASEATIYGGYGAIVGHELTHGFVLPYSLPLQLVHALTGLGEFGDATAKGRYDVEQELSCVADDVGTAPFPSESPVDPWETLNEAAADQGGLELAWRAFHDATLLHRGGPATDFFAAFAQEFCSSDPDHQAPGDTHPPPRLRVDSALRQFPAFAETWHCEAGQPMASHESCDLLPW